MRYEDGRRRRGILRFIIGILIKLIIIIMVCAVIMYIIPVSFFMVDRGEDFSAADGFSIWRINILVIGVDKLNHNSQRADTLIILSVGYGKCAITSIMRDTMVSIPGHGRQKVNAAYAHGGAELTVRTINENFGLNISKYAVVDFVALAELINAVGGVDIAITQSEQTQINRNVANSWPVFRDAGYSRDATHQLNVNFTAADADEMVTAHLDGIQALGYARIRKLDSDYARAARQRKLIAAAADSFKSRAWNPMVYARAGRALANSITTNMNAFELISIGMKAVLFADMPQLRLPVPGSYTDDGSAIIDVNFLKNRDAFIDFAYD